MNEEINASYSVLGWSFPGSGNTSFVFVKPLCIFPFSEKPDTLSEELGLEGEKPSPEEQMKVRWESLNQEFNTKQRLLQKALEQEQLVTIFNTSLHFFRESSHDNTRYSMYIGDARERYLGISSVSSRTCIEAS